MQSEEEPTNYAKASTSSKGDVTRLSSLTSPALHSRLPLIHTRSASFLIGPSFVLLQPITSQTVLPALDRERIVERLRLQLVPSRQGFNFEFSFMARDRLLT